MRVYVQAAQGEFPACISLSVCNTGSEISPDHISQIFDKFYRIPKSDPHRYSGTGLGLALAKKLVLRLGGMIQATSAAGETCFHIQLPFDHTMPLPTASLAAHDELYY